MNSTDVESFGLPTGCRSVGNSGKGSRRIPAVGVDILMLLTTLADELELEIVFRFDDKFNPGNFDMLISYT
jgi:hypothetical protein